MSNRAPTHIHNPNMELSDLLTSLTAAESAILPPLTNLLTALCTEIRLLTARVSALESTQTSTTPTRTPNRVCPQTPPTPSSALTQPPPTNPANQPPPASRLKRPRRSSRRRERLSLDTLYPLHPPRDLANTPVHAFSTPLRDLTNAPLQHLTNTPPPQTPLCKTRIPKTPAAAVRLATAIRAEQASRAAPSALKSVVRGAARDALSAKTCPECEQFFRREAAAFPQPALQYERFLKTACKHRAEVLAPDTPPAYWQLTFEDTLTQPP